MRILHIVPVYEPAWAAGGVVTGITNLCRGLASIGVETTVFTTNADGQGGRTNVPIGQEVNQGGVRTYYFRPSLSNRPWYAHALCTQFAHAARQFDLIYIESTWQPLGIVSSLIALRAKVPFVHGIHGSFDRILLRRGMWKKQCYYYLLLRPLLRRASALHFTTEYERAQSGHWGSMSDSFVVPNPVDPGRFKKLDPVSAKTFRLRYGIPPEAKVVLSIGRLDDPKKGFDLLLQSIAPIMRDDPRVRLVIVGPSRGKGKCTLEYLSSELGVASRVILTGLLSGEPLLAAYTASDLFALLSEDENFGMVVAESMSMELPVLISDTVGIAPDVEAAGAGQVVVRNVDAVYTALKTMLYDDRHLLEMGNHARELVRRRYDPRAVASMMVIAYKDVIHGTRASHLAWRTASSKWSRK